jgi:Zn-dependent protease with chaperone function
MNVESAVKGLAVLTAIPIVLLAIWADYFNRGVDALMKVDPLFDRAAELYKARLVGVGAIFFQFGIFMGTSEVRKEAPILGNLLFAASILIQSVIQSGAERKVRKKELHTNIPTPATTPMQDMEVATRAFLWATAGGALYITSLIVPVILTTQLCNWFKAPPMIAMSAVCLAAVVGMLSGLGINFALGAFYLRRMLPTRPIQDETQLKALESCFVEAGLPTPSFWLVDTGRLPEATAMMAGFQSGKGVFRPGLFISRGMIDSLNDQELRAVVLHEVSHLKLEHLKRRLLYSACLIFATTAAATFCVFMATVLAPATQARGFVGICAAAAAFVLTFKFLSRQSRFHELQADFYCIEKLNAGFENLASALRKLDQINDQDPFRKNPFSKLTGQAHPATESRIALVQAHLAPQEKKTVEKREDRAA